MLKEANGSRLRFEGVAHPRPCQAGKRNDVAYLTPAEIGLTRLGRNEGGTGTPLYREHDVTERVGTVFASFESRDGDLRVVGVVDDADAAARVRNGSLRGLSLGTEVLLGAGGRRVCKQLELSLCDTPMRDGCYIDHIDGQRVHGRVQASSSSSRAPR